MAEVDNRAAPGFVLVVSLQPVDATTTLFFGQRLGIGAEQLRVVAYGSREVAGLLGRASAVIVVRGLFELGDVVTCARALRIPLYYFLDDNFIVLRDHGGIEAAFVTHYSLANVRAALRRFTGVLLATPALVQYFAEQRLHPRVWLFPPVADSNPSAPAPEPRARLHVAFFGGQHLHGMFLSTIVPAIRRLACERPVTLLAAGIPEPIPASEGLVVTHLAYDADYSRGITALAAAGVDLLLHPVAPGLANNIFKNPHAVISAHALGAVPIVSDAPPYGAGSHSSVSVGAHFSAPDAGLATEGVALFCDHSEASWHQALLQAATDQRLAASIRASVDSYCANRFSGETNRTVVAGMLREHRPPAPAWGVIRSGLARGCGLMAKAGRAASRLAKTITPAKAVA